VGLALILDSPRYPQGGLALKEKETNATIDDHLNPYLDDPDDLAAVNKLHTSEKGIEKDVLKSFLDTLR
jgi:hypothetical protein